MASQKTIDANGVRNAPWRKVNVNELANLLAGQTGLDEGDIRQVLRELKDTSVYVNASASGCEGRNRR
ncbi:MAG: hypothetical protein MAG451_00560 [Anaerolineales bacterium]|nr:hypothetical protein [Anaerolineales bacterium]